MSVQLVFVAEMAPSIFCVVCPTGIHYAAWYVFSCSRLLRQWKAAVQKGNNWLNQLHWSPCTPALWVLSACVFTPHEASWLWSYILSRFRHRIRYDALGRMSSCCVVPRWWM